MYYYSYKNGKYEEAERIEDIQSDARRKCTMHEFYRGHYAVEIVKSTTPEIIKRVASTMSERYHAELKADALVKALESGLEFPLVCHEDFASKETSFVWEKEEDCDFVKIVEQYTRGKARYFNEGEITSQEARGKGLNRLAELLEVDEQSSVLPELEGSERQVSWANQIRHDAIEAHPELEELKTITSAGWFIDNRNRIKEAVADGMEKYLEKINKTVEISKGGWTKSKTGNYQLHVTYLSQKFEEENMLSYDAELSPEYATHGARGKLIVNLKMAKYAMTVARNKAGVGKVECFLDGNCDVRIID